MWALCSASRSQPNVREEGHKRQVRIEVPVAVTRASGSDLPSFGPTVLLIQHHRFDLRFWSSRPIPAWIRGTWGAGPGRRPSCRYCALGKHHFAPVPWFARPGRAGEGMRRSPVPSVARPSGTGECVRPSRRPRRASPQHAVVDAIEATVLGRSDVGRLHRTLDKRAGSAPVALVGAPATRALNTDWPECGLVDRAAPRTGRAT